MSWIDALLNQPKVVCECGHASRPNLRDEVQANGSVNRILTCMHCGKETIVARISKKGMALAARLRSETNTRERRRLQKQLLAEVRRGS